MSGGVKKLAQVVVGAVIGFVQGGPVGAVIGAGLAFYAAEQQEKLNTKSPLRDNEPSAQTVRSSKAPVRYILGRVSTGGVLVWAQEERGAQTTGEWLHLVYVLCEGAIDELEYIYLGEELIGSYGADASYELVVNPTQVNTFLKENCPDWKDTQIGRGLSYVRISLRYSAEKFPSGIPDARFVVRGRNDIFDPRTGRSGWTENTALHLLWFLRTRCGVPDEEIVFETFASGANVCNESVQNPDGSSSPRYRSGCVIGADEQRTNVLQKLEAACAGKLIRVGGRWMFQAGAYYGPYDFEITEDMVIGTITGNTEATNDAAINTIRGTFIDPLQSWTETDYPEVSVAQWVEEDGGEAAETLSFSYVSDPYQAQRLANIELRRRRSGGALNIPLNLAGYNCRPGRAVRVNLPSLNILGEFMVTNWSMGTSEGCTASVQAYEAAIFDDAVGKPYNPIGFIKLPAGGLGSPTNLRWDVEDTAEISQGVLSWDRPAGIVSGFAVTVRQAGAAVQALQVPETTTRMPISGLTSGSYTMGVAALGPLARSGEATITVDVNGPPMPETCAVQATIDTITLIPGNTLHGLNGGTYEYFWSPDPAATQGEFLGRGLSITHTGLSFAKSYAYFVRSKNAYGVSAFLKVVAATSMDVGAILEGIKGKITESELGKELTSKIEKIALIDGNGPGSVNERIGTAKTELAKQISDVNNALGTVKGNLEQQITAVSADVSAAKTELQQQIANVSALAGSLPYRKDKAYSVGQSALGSDGKLYQALKAVPLNTPPPNATYWTDVGQAVVAANGMAARVSKVETDVSTLDGKVTAQASQIGGLQSSLTTTNGNVSAAQQAAQDAATLAGGKGKVIVQSAAPAVADRLAQNLWIDTTGNANTPKRWTGSAWVAVTDKVATDAAAAAAGALALAQTKADASAVSSLTTRVSDAEGKLTSQATRMDGMQTSIDGKASSQALQQVTSRVTATEDKDKAQDQLISSQSQALTSLTDSVSKKADTSTVQALGSMVTQQGQELTAQGQSLTKIDVALGQVGGENWIYNPSFEKQGANGLADGWATAGASGVTTTPSLVPSALAAGEMAQRIDVTGVSASAWSRIGNPSTRRVEVSPGTPVSISAFVRGTPGINVRCEIQFLNSAGGGISGVPVASNTALTGDFNRVSHTVLAPAGAVRCNYFVTVYGTASIASGFLEVDRTQIEFSSVITGWRDNGAVDAGNAAATASAVQSLTGRVDQAESSLTSQSGSIVSLQNGLTATNSNVTAAQQAAQAAATAAGAKGEVIYGSSAPAADKRLVQNLWIDTTGNANTPKRWNGSAWVAVTDKVATDAAAAAATALSQVATKAEASAVQALNSKVEQQGSTITANGQAITNLSASLTGLGGGKVNLLPAEYSVFGSTLPALSGSSFNASSVPDAAAMRGYALKLDWSSASTGLAVHFSTSVAAAGMNMALRAKRYIVSYYAKASVAGHQVANYLRVLQADGVSTTTGPAALATLGTDWARYAVVIDMTSATYTGSRMQLSFQMNRSGGADRSVWLDRIMVEEAAEGATAPSAFVPGTSFDQSQLNAEATSALSSRVSQTEQGLTSVSSNVTSLTNSIGQTGGENWIYNPSFEKQGTALLSDGWAIAGGSGAVVTPSRVASALAQGEIAQRIDVTGISSSVWARIGNPSSRRVTVSPGTPVTMSAFVRGTSGLAVRCEVQFLNSSGGGISGTPVATNAIATAEFARITHSVVAPEGTVECNFFVTCYGTAAISNAFMEVDRTQLEFSATVSGWKDNGKVAIAEQGALSTAVESLSSAVTQQGGTLTSVSSRTTALENSVNSGSNGLATKASAASVTTLGNRVSAAENSLTSASSSITDLQNTLGSVGGAVNLVPAEYSVFGATPPAMNKQASLNASSVTSADAVGKYLLKLDSTVSQVNYFYLAASGTDWTMKLKPGKKYILSFWVQADAARAMSLRIRYPNAAGSNVEAELAQVNVTTAMTRVSAVLTMPAALVGSSCLVFYQSRTASASSHLYDGFMLEEQVGANETPSTFSVGYSARETQAASRALSELSSTVSTQGGTITAQAQRIDGLQSAVGNASAAIQDEAKTRSDADSALSTRITTAQAKADDALAAAQSEVTVRANADSALGKRVDGVQSSLGSTNAAVQQISTAQTGLNNKVNASYSVRLQVVNGNQYVAAGFGVGVENDGGVLQSTFAVMADRFAVLNPSGNGFVNPFAIQNGQVFLNEAFISTATIQRAIVGNSINSSELANNGVPIMRMDFASGTIIMQNKAASAYTVFNRSGIDMVINGVRRIRMGEW
ncbi:phage tail tip fiber protein [Pseudomonas fulva]|uniref:phage tail tip fiber protein n=1 Tax=Pseudomonas fulva TaxID=47880 RepID=UPI003D9BC35A